MEKSAGTGVFSGVQMGDCHEAFAIHPGSFRCCHMHGNTCGGAKRWVVRLLRSRPKWLQELQVRDIAAMLGRCARCWRELLTQSALRAAAATSGIDDGVTHIDRLTASAKAPAASQNSPQSARLVFAERCAR